MGFWGPDTYPRHDAPWAFGETKTDAGLVFAGTQKASAVGTGGGAGPGSAHGGVWKASALWDAGVRWRHDRIP